MIDKDMTCPMVSQKTGFTHSTIYTITTGTPNTYPTLAQAFALEWLTQGYVQAWEWLDNPYIQNRVRLGQLAGAREFERVAKSFILKYGALTKPDGVIRQKARALSKLFGVEWGEVKKRLWSNSRVKANKEKADVSHLFIPKQYEDITQEEHDSQD